MEFEGENMNDYMSSQMVIRMFCVMLFALVNFILEEEENICCLFLFSSFSETEEKKGQEC